jgi:hypothetical protein
VSIHSSRLRKIQIIVIAPFQISAFNLRIPQGWKVNWDHISNGRTIYPELRFESLLCLSLPPDFVLDFGWNLRDEGVRFDLQINRGHFGISDVVFYQSWFAFDPALAALQLWLERLTAPEADRAADTDLQERLDAIEKRIRHYFIPPQGEQVEEPFARYLRRLILKEPGAWWETGSGDAAIQYRNRYGVVQSQLIFVLREPHGVHIGYHGPDEPVQRLVKTRSVKKALPDIQITLGGAPWDLPANEFVSRAAAARIVAAFVDEGTGLRPRIGRWIAS